MKINKNNFSIDLFHQSKLINHPDNVNKQRAAFAGNDLHKDRMFHLIESVKQIEIEGLVIEFGVYSAKTTNGMAETVPERIVHGFDSFKGLPEDWRLSNNWPLKHRKGHFAVSELPQVRQNVKLWEGWFNETIPVFKKQYTDNIAFLHVDCDLYSSTKTIFDELNNQIVKNTLIVFDEFYAWGRKEYPLWYEHEYLACKEWVEKYDREFEVISHNHHQQCCIKVLN